MSGWISVKDRLPEENPDIRFVLVYGKLYPEYVLGRFRHYDKTWTFSGSNSDWSDAITHWMPLPEPPVGEDE